MLYRNPCRNIIIFSPFFIKHHTWKMVEQLKRSTVIKTFKLNLTSEDLLNVDARSVDQSLGTGIGVWACAFCTHVGKA